MTGKTPREPDHQMLKYRHTDRIMALLASWSLFVLGFQILSSGAGGG